MRRHLWAVGLLIALLFMVDQPPGYSKELRSAAKMRFDQAVLSPPELRAFLRSDAEGSRPALPLDRRRLRREPDNVGRQSGRMH